MNPDLKQAANDALEVKLETSAKYANRLLTDGRFAMQEKAKTKYNAEAKALYEAGRRDQIRLGLRAPNAHENGVAIRRKWDDDAKAESTMTAAQIEAVTEFSQAQFEAVSATEATDMKRDASARYRLYRIAGATHGKLPRSILETLNIADAVGTDDELLQPIPGAVAEKLGLDPTMKVNKVGMDRALQSYADKIVAEKLAEQQKVAA
jgi:hypothetical protein